MIDIIKNFLSKTQVFTDINISCLKVSNQKTQNTICVHFAKYTIVSLCSSRQLNWKYEYSVSYRASLISKNVC